jgi:MFS transporter, ACS family, hexuronate transporter
VTFFSLAAACNYLDRLVLSAASPRIRAEFHLSNQDYGWLVAAFGLAYALASPAVGIFLDWLGLETGIVCAVAMWSAAAGVCGLTRSFSQLVGARAFLGIWESAGFPAAGKVNAIYLEPKNRATGAALGQVGIAIAGVAAPLLVAAVTGWRTAFFVCAALGFLWIPLWMLVRRTVAPYSVVAPSREGGAGNLLRDPRLITLAIANILWMGIYALWTNWTTEYLSQTFHLTMAQANSYAWFPPVASTLGGFMGGWISSRSIGRGMGNVQARVFGALVSAVGCLVTLLAPWCPSPFWATLVIAASYFWATAGSVNLYTIPVDIWGGERAGTAISALVFAYGLLQFAISPSIGYLVDHFGFTPVFWLVALPPLGGWALLRRLRFPTDR